MKKFFRVVALVAVFILSSFGVSDAAYNFVSMSNLTPAEFAQQVTDRSEQLGRETLTFTEPAYAGPDADDDYTVYIAHMGKCTTVKFRCDRRGKVSSLLLKQSVSADASQEVKDAVSDENFIAKQCILGVIGLTDEEIGEFYTSPDIDSTKVTEKTYPRIAKRVTECRKVDIEYGSVLTYVHSDMFLVSMD